MQLCRQLRPRDSSAMCVCAASAGGVTHLLENGVTQLGEGPASKNTKEHLHALRTTAHISLRETYNGARLATRAARALRHAMRAERYHPRKKGGQGWPKLEPVWLLNSWLTETRKPSAKDPMAKGSMHETRVASSAPTEKEYRHTELPHCRRTSCRSNYINKSTCRILEIILESLCRASQLG